MTRYLSNWCLTHPLFVLGALALALAGAGILLVLSGMQAAARRSATDKSKQLGQIESELRELSRSLADVLRPANAPSALDPARRSQAVMLLEHGGDPALVAAEIGAPRNQIELLMKIRRITRATE